MIDEAAVNEIIERELEAAKLACAEWVRYRDALMYLREHGRWPGDASE